MSNDASYDRFLGAWILVPESCDYQQSEPPRSGTYSIEETADGLRFDMSWVDDEGEAHTASFSAAADGKPAPFDGGDLADALSVTLVSSRELNSSAFWRGKERMVAQRQLDEGGNAMRVVQLVRLPDGTTLANTSVYRREVLN